MAMRVPLFRYRATGSVAVEMAIILPLFLMLLALPLFFARVFWFYSAGEKAAHDAARYLSAVSQAEMRTIGTGFNETKVAATARWIAQQELDEILPSSDGIAINLSCQGGSVGSGCGTGIPATVYVGVTIALHDTLLKDISEYYLGNSAVNLNSNVTMRYVGN